MYLPAIVMVGYYFEKKRAFATGIAVCGSGIGAFVFAPLCEKLIEEYSWKGATWIIAAICLNGTVCGALFRPLEVVPRKRSRTIVSSASKTDTKLPNMDVIISPEPIDVLRQKYKPVDHVKVQSAALVHSMQNLPASCDESSNLYSPCISMSCDDMRMCREVTDAGLRKRLDQLRRPLYRKDILYSGSVKHLPEYRESGTMDKYVTSIPPDTTSRDRGTCSTLKKSCKSLTDTFKVMMDFTVLKQPVFCIYGLSCFLCMAGKHIAIQYCLALPFQNIQVYVVMYRCMCKYAFCFLLLHPTD